MVRVVVGPVLNEVITRVAETETVLAVLKTILITSFVILVVDDLFLVVVNRIDDVVVACLVDVLVVSLVTVSLSPVNVIKRVKGSVAVSLIVEVLVVSEKSNSVDVLSVLVVNFVSKNVVVSGTVDVLDKVVSAVIVNVVRVVADLVVYKVEVRESTLLVMISILVVEVSLIIVVDIIVVVESVVVVAEAVEVSEVVEETVNMVVVVCVN